MLTRMKLLGLLLVPVLCFTFLGCGPKNPTTPVQGKATFSDGSPLPEGTKVVFIPQVGKRQSSVGVVKADGTFALEHETGTEGAEIGTYAVKLLPPDDANQRTTFTSLVPEDYIDETLTGVKIEVKTGMAPIEIKTPIRKLRKKKKK